MPHCELCGEQQTFFFQVAFPAGHPWSGLSLAVFACTASVHRDHTIPAMLRGPLKGTDIPPGFLDDYQVNFRLLVFDTRAAEPRPDHTERVAFRPWRLVPVARPVRGTDTVGCRPRWLLEDESPAIYASATEMVFLMQLAEERRFDIVADAPPQAQVYTIPGLPPDPDYGLFNSNALYFFGTRDRQRPLVYLVTQTD